LIEWKFRFFFLIERTINQWCIHKWWCKI
jgi:hypothetical protein